MSLHYGDPTRDGRLKKTLDFLLERGPEGATRLEIRQLTKAEAVNSDIDELRSWLRDFPTGAAPYHIPRAKPEGASPDGGKVYRYFAFKRLPNDAPGQEVFA